jgi:transcriptional regulator with PAS, ATPase and Fis domain
MDMDWAKTFNAAITVCDTEGIILEMNEQSALVFQNDGGFDLIGRNIFDCHPEPSRSKVMDLLKNPRTNVYTIEKNGKKKMVYQSPWYKGDRFAGIVEISMTLPEDVPHFIRK